MAYKQKGSPLHKHMVNSWEEEDVKRGRKLEAEGHKGHAEALYDDAHDSNCASGCFHGGYGEDGDDYDGGDDNCCGLEWRSLWSLC